MHLKVLKQLVTFIFFTVCFYFSNSQEIDYKLSLNARLQLNPNPSNTINRLRKGTTIKILNNGKKYGEYKGYYAARYKNQTGYINDIYISKNKINPFKSSNIQENFSKVSYNLILITDASLRIKPNANSDVIKRISKGEIIQAIGKRGKYYKTNFNDDIGYIHSSWVEKTTENIHSNRINANETLPPIIVKNVRVTQEGNQVTILYDLTGEAEEFNIDLFYSIDDGKTWEGPLKSVTGDVGSNIKPGTNKRMIWNVLTSSELEEGYMQFKVEAGSIIPPPRDIQTTQKSQVPDLALRKYKTGKTISLVLGIVSAGTGVYAYLQGNKLYDEYKTTTDDATYLRSKVETYDIIYPVAFAVAGASTVSFIVYSAKHGKAKKELTFQPVPLHNGGGLAVSFRF